ncbi:MAG: lipoate--protein ligase family protein [Syntrophales bacterium]|nr:lipoate--protein ligase family protein [Syntrophales bacterium]
MQTWRLLPFERLDGYENMAVDEAVFRESVLSGGPPTLRFYLWKRPVVTIGYGQDVVAEVNLEFCGERNIDIIRRPTGGKAVYHDAELTYSVVASQARPPFKEDIVTTYRAIAACLILGLDRLGIAAELAERGLPDVKDSLEGCCFAVPYRNELLVEGAKICGSAQARSRGHFLQHGSILIDFDALTTSRVMTHTKSDEKDRVRYLERAVTCVRKHAKREFNEETLAHVIGEGFEEEMNMKLQEEELTLNEQTLKKKLLSGKYLTQKWNLEGRT